METAVPGPGAGSFVAEKAVPGPVVTSGCHIGLEVVAASMELGAGHGLVAGS